MSLIEVMVSQVLVIILITGLVALVAALVKKLNSEANVSDAQVKLRQASHLILRDTQGIGGDAAQSGDVVVIADNSTNAAVADLGTDILTVFKRDESICNGGLNGVQGAAGNNFLTFSGTCPITSGASACSVAELGTRRALIKNGASSVQASLVADATACTAQFTAGLNPTLVANYNVQFKRGCEAATGVDGTPTTGSCTTIPEVIAHIGIGATSTQMLIGTSFTYKVLGGTLQRSLNGGVFEPVLSNIFDLQVERIFDIDGDGRFEAVNEAGDVEIVSASTGSEPATATADTFSGMRLGIVAFSRSADGVNIRPPTNFSNHSLAAAPTGRRYRSSFIFAAARNSAGE